MTNVTVYEEVPGESLFSAPYCFSERSVEGLYSVKSGYAHGAETSRFYRMKREGRLLPLNTYVRYDLKREGQWFGSASYTNGGDCTGPVTHSGVPWLISPLDPNIEKRVNTPARAFCPNETALLQAALADAQPDLDILTSLAELHKTLDLLSNAQSRAKDLMSRALRSKYGAVSAVSDAWLEWRYGWRILGYDLKSLSEFVSKPVRSFISGRAGTSVTVNGMADQAGYHQLTVLSDRVRINYQTIWDDDISFRANVIGVLKETSVNALIDLPTTAWELIPFSFVADWFLSVGDCIKAWEVVTKADLIASIGTKRTITGRSTITGATIVEPIQYSSASGYGESTWVSLSKTRTPVGLPTLLPQFNVRMNVPKAIDLAALIVSNFGPLSKGFKALGARTGQIH